MWIEISKAKDWPGIGKGYNIRLPHMPSGTTVYAKNGDELEERIEKVVRDFSLPVLVEERLQT